MEAFLKEFQHLKIQLEEIKSATRNFDKSNIIGKGGFGKVYQGEASHSMGQSIVAFKRLDRNYGQGDPEFFKEILMLSRYTHENLISLVGFCDDDGEKILVYEHAFHGSLDSHLSSNTLTWRQRLKICLAAAKGLSYLHDPNGTQQRLIHRDIKSSNILLDANWNAKVSDMGLSKIGPANQQHTFLVSNVVGTFGYIDPLYMETSILTKESDVFSFGVVLFEVLCGRLCFQYNNGHLQSLVQMWKKSYKQKKLDQIIFQVLKQHMDPSSLETFSDIAYRCLQKSREERPKMSHVVEKLEIALRFQEICEVVESHVDYEEISMYAIPPVVYGSEQELKMHLSKGIFVNNGKTWFLLNKNGEHCEMISAAECLIPIHSVSPEHADYGPNKSRFVFDYYSPFCWKFKTRVRTQFLSPHVAYTLNLVFDISYGRKDYLGLSYILAGETKSSTSYLAEKREDGWLMAELYQFTSDSRNVDLEITFECRYPLLVEGIEFQPLERAEHHVLEDEDVDMQTDTYWEQKIPNDYEDVIKLARYPVEWTTKKELYYILCQGFPIKNGEEWFSLGKNGKKCYMLPATAALGSGAWTWQSLSESRFKQVAVDPHGSFSINTGTNILSPETTYAIYLVYRIQENHSGSEPPVKVSIGEYQSWYIYLLSPQAPTIKPKAHQNTHNPLHRPKMKGLPQQRDDGWMEVQVWEYKTNITNASISVNLRFTVSNKKSLKGLIMQGIEFKPI